MSTGFLAALPEQGLQERLMDVVVISTTGEFFIIALPLINFAVSKNRAARFCRTTDLK